jgi:phage recombination protein Bet
MSTTLATQQSNTLATNDQELMSVLENSLYPGASHDSIKMVIGYCKAAGLDVLQKPVHIVPMYAATGKKDNRGYDIKAMRDVIMPGIGLYRTQAARGGSYAGVTEPEFGPDVTETLGGQEITYPAWCKITVKRTMSNGMIAEFSAYERWKENYATKSRDSAAPNAMWTKRPYGQIAKCTEAQALRKAFPELGSAPTADEMEGKQFSDETAIDGVVVRDVKREEKPTELPQYDAGQFEVNFPAWKDLIHSGKKTADQLILKISTKGWLSEQQKDAIRGCKGVEIDSFAVEMETEDAKQSSKEVAA